MPASCPPIGPPPPSSDTAACGCGWREDGNDDGDGGNMPEADARMARLVAPRRWFLRPECKIEPEPKAVMPQQPLDFVGVRIGSDSGTFPVGTSDGNATDAGERGGGCGDCGDCGAK